MSVKLGKNKKKGRKGKSGKRKERGRDLPCDIVVFNILLYQTDNTVFLWFYWHCRVFSHQMSNNCEIELNRIVVN